MFMMCSMKGCTEKHSMCGHEKMRRVAMLTGIVGVGTCFLLA